MANTTVTVKGDIVVVSQTSNSGSNIVVVPQPASTQIFTVTTPGPQGQQGIQGPQGPAGDADLTSFITTSSFNELTGSFNQFTSSYNTSSFTGSFVGTLIGTSSYATTASYTVSSSYANTSSFTISASYTTTASYSVSSSYTITSSFAISSSFSTSASFAPSASRSVSSSYAISSSYSVTSSYATEAATANSANSAGSSTTANFANSANQSDQVLINDFQPAGGDIISIWDLDYDIINANAIPFVNVTQVGDSPDYRTPSENDKVVYDTDSNGLYVFGEKPKIVVGQPGQIDGYVTVYGKIAAYGIGTLPNSIQFLSDLERRDSVLATVSFNTSSNNLTIDGGGFAGTFTGNLTGTASWANNYNEKDPIFTAKSASLATTGSNTFKGTQTFSGSLLITGDAIIYGSSSLINVTASQLEVGTNVISVNVFEPIQRFGGLRVYDSGSSSATASLYWDSQNNNWIYQNVTGSTYSGGGLISGPRNTGSLGDETYPTQNRVVKGQGGDHIMDSNITDTGTLVSVNSNTEVTGSLIATAGITGSLFGTASWAINSTNSSTASYAPNYVLISATSSMLLPYMLISSTSSMLSPYLLISSTSSMLSPYLLINGTASMLSPYMLISSTSSMLSPYLLSSQTGSITVLSSSYAKTASIAITSQTASYVLQAVSSSYTATSSFATTATSASYVATASFATTALTASYWSGTLDQVNDVIDYTASTITDGYQLAWNSGSQRWEPAAGAAAKGTTRLFVSANKTNANAFYYNSITVTADSSANPSATTAFMVTSTLLTKVNVYFRSDATPGSTRIDLYKNANGSGFASATSSIANATFTPTTNTITTYTFTGLTLNQFDSIHIKVTPTNSPGQTYAIVTIE